MCFIYALQIFNRDFIVVKMFVNLGFLEIIEAMMDIRANSMKKIKRLCKEYGFTAGMLKGALAEMRIAKRK